MNISNKIKTIDKILPEMDKMLGHCELCVRKCGVDRKNGERGFCAAGAQPVVYSYSSHHGEEPAISGSKGSGTIFFSHCTMKCVYCQNWQFSQSDEGREVSSDELADIMLELQKKGCHNINLVNPTHFVPTIVKALKRGYDQGLDIPIVYNTGGYDSFRIIKSLEGIVDIYLPDMRYSMDMDAQKYSEAYDYVENNRAIIKEMHRQVGDLSLTSLGIAKKGLIIRLLTLPEGISGTIETLRWIRNDMGKNVYLSVMSQYYPAYKSRSYDKLSRRIKKDEYDKVLREIEILGMDKGWIQPFDSEFDARFQGESFESNV